MEQNAAKLIILRTADTIEAISCLIARKIRQIHLSQIFNYFSLFWFIFPKNLESLWNGGHWLKTAKTAVNEN